MKNIVRMGKALSNLHTVILIITPLNLSGDGVENGSKIFNEVRNIIDLPTPITPIASLITKPHCFRGIQK